MKKILIVTAPTTGADTAVQERMAAEGAKSTPQFSQILSTAFVGEGDRSLEVAQRLADIASQHNLPCAAFELESELFRRT